MKRALLPLLLAGAALAGYEPKWHCAPYLYGPTGKPIGSFEYCQDVLSDWCLEVGHSDVGLKERVYVLDQPLPGKAVVTVLRKTPTGPDTLWFAEIPVRFRTSGERSYLCVVEDVEVPDSLRVILSDGSTFNQPVERKR